MSAPGRRAELLTQRHPSLVDHVDAGAAASESAAPGSSGIPPSAASTGVDTGVVADPLSGALSWQGLPVSAGPDGSPLVHTTSGAMTPAAFTAAGLDAEAERVAIGLSRLTGSAKKTSLPTRNPRFYGGGS